MNWRAFFAVAIAAGLAFGFAPSPSQAATNSTTASVSLNHFYIITSYGFGVLNDSFTFKNNGTSAVQIPALQVGLPSKIAARTFGVVLSPSDKFSVSQTQATNSTILTITPDQPTLNAGANSTVVLRAVLNNILNYSNGIYSTSAHALVLLSPSLNVNVTQMKSTIILPGGGNLAPAPSGFSIPASNATSPAYTISFRATRCFRG